MNTETCKLYTNHTNLVCERFITKNSHRTHKQSLNKDSKLGARQHGDSITAISTADNRGMREQIITKSLDAVFSIVHAVHFLYIAVGIRRKRGWEDDGR
jgi:hypothetical protein